MAIINCPKCGKLFSDESGEICSICRKDDLDVFERVRDYIKENPDRSIVEVSHATEVSRKKIVRYIREGRIEISRGMLDDVRCESCNRPITTGRYCPECSVKLSSNLKGAIADYGPKPEENKKPEPMAAKMHLRRGKSKEQ